MSVNFDRTPSMSNDDPRILLTGHIVGGYSAGGNVYGGFIGTVESATLANWTPSSGIPWQVMDAFLQNDGYRISATVTGGTDNTQFTLVTFSTPFGYVPSSAPLPAPVPESGTHLGFVALFTGVAVRYGRRRSR